MFNNLLDDRGVNLNSQDSNQVIKNISENIEKTKILKLINNFIKIEHLILKEIANCIRLSHNYTNANISKSPNRKRR